MEAVQRGSYVIVTSERGEEIGTPGELEVIDMIGRLKREGRLTPAAASLIAIGKVPIILTRIHQPDGQTVIL